MGSDSHLAKIRQGAGAFNAWRRQEPSVRPDLQGMSLTLGQKQWGEMNGGPIDLSYALLHDADLRHATLIRANLERASLSGADLAGARLNGANLRGAVVTGVGFDDADLADAVFTEADLRGADFSRARNLDAGQLAWARGDATTLLPPHVAAPRAWSEPVSRHLSQGPKAAIAPRAADTAAARPAETPRLDPQTHRPGTSTFVPVKLAATRMQPAGADPARKEAVDAAKQAGTKPAAAPAQAIKAPEPQARGGASASAAAAKVVAPASSATAAATARAAPATPTAAASAAAGGPERAQSPPPASVAQAKTPSGRGASASRPMPPKDWSATLPQTKKIAKPQVELAEVEVVKLKRPAARSDQRFDMRLALVVGVAGLLVLAGAATLLAPPAADSARPQRLAVSESRGAAAVDDIGASAPADIDDVNAVAVPPGAPAPPAAELSLPAIEHAPVRAPPSTALEVDDLAHKSAQVAPGTDGPPASVPVEAAPAPVARTEVLSGRTAEVRPVLDPTPSVDLPKVLPPRAAGRAPDAEQPQSKDAPTAKPAQVAKVDPNATPAPASAASVVDYLARPVRSSEWVETFIRDYYLSASALDGPQIRRIYSDPVDYFGNHKMDLGKVVEAKSRYYRLWPRRHYELVPGSISLKWLSPTVAEVTFLYRYAVSSPRQRGQKGRGRAHVTLDLGGTAGKIIREDGELIGRN